MLKQAVSRHSSFHSWPVGSLFCGRYDYKQWVGHQRSWSSSSNVWVWWEGFPHSTKPRTDTSWLSYNSAQFWHSTEVAADSMGKGLSSETPTVHLRSQLQTWVVACNTFFFFLVTPRASGRPRIKPTPTPQQPPKPLQWQCWIINLLCHKGTPVVWTSDWL